MDKTLSGDRNIEYGYAWENLPYTHEAYLFDLGCGKSATMSIMALERGYNVIAIDLQPITTIHNPNFQFLCGDFFNVKTHIEFDWILNISSIEHFGLCRYGTKKYDENADLRAMAKLRNWLKDHGKMILTVPVGVDHVHRPWHRVYGTKRLPLLLDGYFILDEKYWAKTDDDEYHEVEKDYALSETSEFRGGNKNPSLRCYYALGAFTLRRINK